MAKKPADTVNLILRLPKALHRRLTQQARRNNVSLNTEIINELEGREAALVKWVHENIVKPRDEAVRRVYENRVRPRIEAGLDQRLCRIEALLEDIVQARREAPRAGEPT
jgi:hypothetical protein